MNALQRKIPAALATLLLGAWATAFAASPDQQPGAATPPDAAQEKVGDRCASLDKDRDGYVSASEWKGLKKDAKAFQTADANQDGRLDLMECAKGLGS